MPGELSSEKAVRGRASEEAHLGETLREMQGRATSRVGSRCRAWQCAGASGPVPGRAGRPDDQRRECQAMKSEREAGARSPQACRPRLRVWVLFSVRCHLQGLGWWGYMNSRTALVHKATGLAQTY